MKNLAVILQLFGAVVVLVPLVGAAYVTHAQATENKEVSDENADAIQLLEIEAARGRLQLDIISQDVDEINDILKENNDLTRQLLNAVRNLGD